MTVVEKLQGELQLKYSKTKYIFKSITEHDSEIKHTACPSCGGEFHPIISVNTQSGKSVLEKSICGSCLYITYTRSPKKEWFADHYATQWDQSTEHKLTKRKADHRYPRIFDILEPKFANKDVKILECGAGYGGALSYLKENNYRNAYGVEPSEKRWRFCKDRGLNVSNCGVEDINKDPVLQNVVPFDVIYSWHVLEHVFDIDQTMEAASELVRPDGYIYLSVPNVLHEHFLSIGLFLLHIHNFNFYSLRYVLNKYGFELEYFDEKIRLIARKTDNVEPVLPTPEEKFEYLKALNTKLENDFQSEKNRAFDKDEVQGRFFTKWGEDSYGHIELKSDLDWRSKAGITFKEGILGTNPIVRPLRNSGIQVQNLLDIKNMLKWTMSRFAELENREYTGTYTLNRLEYSEDENIPPHLVITYQDDRPGCWLK